MSTGTRATAGDDSKGRKRESLRAAKQMQVGFGEKGRSQMLVWFDEKDSSCVLFVE